MADFSNQIPLKKTLARKKKFFPNTQKTTPNGYHQGGSYFDIIDPVQPLSSNTTFVSQSSVNPNSKIMKSLIQKKESIEHTRYSYIFNKLLGNAPIVSGTAELPDTSDGSGYQQRMNLLTSAESVTIYVNGTPDFGPAQFTRLTPPNAIKENLYAGTNKDLYFIDVLGTEKAEELKRYFEVILPSVNVSIIHSDEPTETIIEKELEPVFSFIQNKQIILTILPLNVCNTLDQKLYHPVAAGPVFRLYSDQNNYFNLFLSINWCNGPLTETIIDLISRYCTLLDVKLYGTAGSLTDEFSGDSLIAPLNIKPLDYLDKDHMALSIQYTQLNPNFSPPQMQEPKPTHHASVSSVIDETVTGIASLLERGVQSVDMEGYHLIKKLKELENPPTVEMIFRILDHVLSHERNLEALNKNPTEQTLSFARRDQLNEQALNLLGFITQNTAIYRPRTSNVVNAEKPPIISKIPKRTLKVSHTPNNQNILPPPVL